MSWRYGLGERGREALERGDTYMHIHVRVCTHTYSWFILLYNRNTTQYSNYTSIKRKNRRLSGQATFPWQSCLLPSETFPRMGSMPPLTTFSRACWSDEPRRPWKCIQYARDTEQRGSATVLGGRIRFQNYAPWLERCIEVNEIMFNKEKCAQAQIQKDQVDQGLANFSLSAETSLQQLL